MSGQVHPYRAETLDLLNRLEAAGFTLLKVNDGEETTKTIAMDIERIADLLTSVDESTLYVRRDSTDVFWLFLVFGNSPGELVCDYSGNSRDLDHVTREHADAWEGGAA